MAEVRININSLTPNLVVVAGSDFIENLHEQIKVALMQAIGNAQEVASEHKESKVTIVINSLVGHSFLISSDKMDAATVQELVTRIGGDKPSETLKITKIDPENA